MDDPGQLWAQLQDWLMAPEGGLGVALRLLGCVAILVAAKIAASVLGGLTRRAVDSPRFTGNALLRDFFVNVVRKVVFITGLLMAIGQLGVEIGPLLAGVGVVGFVVGFALQESLANFAAGVMILLYRPYDIGDWVEVTGGTGKVESMSLVSTTIATGDNQCLVIPNGKIWGNVIRNVNANATRRVDLAFGIGYGDDVDRAVCILQSILEEHPLTLADPAPVVRLHALGESAVEIIARPWVRTPDYWTVRWDITREVKRRFDSEGIHLPFPQRDVHLHGAVPKA